MNIDCMKKRIREYIWKLLEEKNVARFPRPVWGRIPNFVGAEKAAEKLFKTRMWCKTEVLKINPDSPQRPIRYRALIDDKKVVMATPKLREGFLLLDPRKIPSNKYMYASSIKGAFIYGRKISLNEIPVIDLVVTGCVAVDKYGGRLGKGGGYAELEYAILREIGVVDKNIYVVTTIHDLQIVNKIPLEEHDLTVDIIFTPTKTIYVEPRPRKPCGIIWEKLGDKSHLPIILELKKYLYRR